MLGCGSWDAVITRRGGGNIVMDVPFYDLSMSYSLNNSSSFRLGTSEDIGADCCEIWDGTLSWRDELALYRDGRLVVTGPLTRRALRDGQLTLEARDLSFWYDKRWVERSVTLVGNPVRIFEELHDIAMEVDDSPNISVLTQATDDEPVVREFSGVQKQRASDGMRELSSSTLLDYVTVGRTVYAGNLDGIFGTTHLLVHTEGVISIDVDENAEKLATDLAVIGAIGGRDQHPAEGRAKRSGEYFGVLQETVTDLRVRNNQEADAASVRRLEAMYPFPSMYQVTFAAEAQPEFGQLVPGVVLDMKVARGSGCIEVNDEMVLTGLNVSVRGADETITGTIGPIGEDE